MNINELRKEMMKTKVSDKNKSLVLSMLLAETLLIAKNDKNREVQDDDILQAAKRLIKKAEQSLSFGVVGAEYEISILKEFLPKQLSEDETKEIVVKLKELFGNNIGFIMKEIKSQYNGTIDMKLVNTLLKG